MSNLLCAVAAVANLVVISGALAPASLGVLERVERNRAVNGWWPGTPLPQGDYAPPGTVLVAVHDCAYLGRNGWLIVPKQDGYSIEDVGIYPARVVDCQQADHMPLATLGLAADVNQTKLGHRQAILWLMASCPANKYFEEVEMLRWIGREKGMEGLPNVPARDLSAEEAERYGGRKWLVGTGLYEENTLTSPPPPPRGGEGSSPHPGEGLEGEGTVGVIDLEDGISDDEATLAGKALRQRRRRGR